MRRRGHLLLPVALICFCNGAVARDWFAYSSDNFTVYSDAPRGEVIRVLENFEVFRRVVLATLDLPNETESENLKIVVFDRPRDFDSLAPSDQLGGFFYHSVFGPRMIVGPTYTTEYSQQTLFHEYVHYLMGQHSTANYPRWYGEGLAGVLDMTEIDRSSATVGLVRRFSTSSMPVSEVIDMTYDDMDADFYYTSWLMVHYLMIDSADDPGRRRNTVEYLRRYDAGEESIQAFVDSFGMSIADMQRLLDSYARRQRYTIIEFPEVEYLGELTSRGLSEGEDLYLLGDLAVELANEEAAHDYFDRFEELEIESPLTDNVRSRRAIAFVHADMIEEGDSIIEMLLASRPEDADVLADVAHYAYDRYVYARDHSIAGAEQFLNRAIEYGERAVAANSADLEALFYLGLSYEHNGALQQAADTLLRSYDINPSVTVLNMNLARVMIKGNQKDLGLYLISRVYSSAHSDDAREEVRTVQRLIEAEDFDVSTIDRIL